MNFPFEWRKKIYLNELNHAFNNLYDDLFQLDCQIESGLCSNNNFLYICVILTHMLAWNWLIIRLYDVHKYKNHGKTTSLFICTLCMYILNISNWKRYMYLICTPNHINTAYYYQFNFILCIHWMGSRYVSLLSIVVYRKLFVTPKKME